MVVIVLEITVSTTVPVLVLKLVSPAYEALIVSLPTESGAVVVTVAMPLTSVPVPRAVDPHVNVTAPVGMPVPGELGLTVALIVSDCPKTEGAGEVTTVVVVPAWFTVCDRAAEELLVKSGAPPYVTVIACEPSTSKVVEVLAVPPLSVHDPMADVPS